MTLQSLAKVMVHIKGNSFTRNVLAECYGRAIMMEFRCGYSRWINQKRPNNLNCLPWLSFFSNRAQKTLPSLRL